MIGLLPRVQSRSSAVVRTCIERPAIAVAIHELAGGGSRRDAILLCNALAEKGIPITILTLREAGPLRHLVDSRVPVVELPGGRIRSAFFGMRRAIRDIAPSVVLCSESSLNLCCLAAVRTLPRSNRPRIVLREVASPSAAQQHDPSWQSRLSYQILHRFYRFADRVITLTDGARYDLMENFSVPADKVVVMRSNSVITPEIAKRIARWDGVEGREENLIVSVGRLSPEKNHKLLLEALALLRNKRPWRLALVGDGQERPALEEYVKANRLTDRVTFVGYTADPFAWLMRAQLAVCSSVYEGLCNAIIEALGCGTPVVSTDCPFGPGEILQKGRYGTLVPVGDAAAMAAAIDASFDAPVDRSKLIARALNYTADRAADSFLEIVRGL